ncbi:MAG: 16S rRNA (cytosine(967)-C(5))-methyltransferase RsmB [Firmicutes bacterium]|nr:16S rRNA (cytosine(967)-C(5))-methyltransferase RsmB [Bacillota bacterium]
MNNKPCNERKEAVEILLKVFQEGAYSSILLQQTFNTHPEWNTRQKALIANLVYTVLTHYLRLECMVDLYSKTPVCKMEPYVAMVLMVSAAQFLWMDKIPQSAVVDEAVKLITKSPHRRLSGFVNAILRTMLRENLRESWPEAGTDLLEHLSVRYSIPRWILEMWEKTYGLDQTKKLAQYLTIPRNLSIRCNTLKITRNELEDKLTQRLGAENVHRGKCCPESLILEGAGNFAAWPEFVEGLFTVQDESSMVCAHVLNPQPGEKVLDMCAAPGGKSSHMAQLMKNKGLVCSRDVHEHKIKLMQTTAKRLGLDMMKPELGDALVAKDSDHEAWDRVLLDAPCSGLGIIRNKPDLKIHKSMKELQELVPLQRQMLDRAADCVRSGGVLVYSTCTLHPGENEENVAWFLARHPEFQAVSAADCVPEGFPMGQVTEQYTYVFPEKEYFDGFFIAKFRKR